MKKEIELKYRLKTKQELELFEQFLEPLRSGNKSILRQENFYFDTSALSLKKNGISLRLRKENSEYLLCAKQSLKDKKQKNHLSMRLEYQGLIDPDIGQLLINQLVSPIEVFLTLPTKNDDDESTKKTLARHMQKSAKTGLQIIGSFINHRIMVPVEIDTKTFIFELDHSAYPNSIEYSEVEVEFSSLKQVLAMRKSIEELFKKCGIRTYKASSKSSTLYKILFG